MVYVASDVVYDKCYIYPVEWKMLSYLILDTSRWIQPATSLRNEWQAYLEPQLHLIGVDGSGQPYEGRVHP